MNYKLMIFDLDGVFTDGGMYYSNQDDILRKFNAKDGLGIKLLQQTNIIPMIITGKKSSSVEKRAEVLNIKYLYTNVRNKLKRIDEICERFKVNYSEIIYMGDDWNDYPVLEKIGFPICVKSSVEEIKDICNYITKRDGGNGAVREAIEFVLKKEKLYKTAVNKFKEYLNS